MRRLNLALALALVGVPAGRTSPAPAWLATPPRIVQTLLREPDVRGYDVAAVLAHLRAVHANAIVINGGGVIDFFRHDHPLAHPTSYLENRDILAELTAACHAAGIRVLARVDFRGVERARYERRPEWFALDAAGRPATRESGLHHTCFNGGYRNEYGLHLIRQLLARYDIDGIWYNSVQSPGACYCAECERKYRAATGTSIPRVADTVAAFLGPEMAPYRTLKARWALEHLGRVREVIKSFGADRVLSVEIFGMYSSRPGAYGGIDVATVSPVVDFLLGKVFVDEDDDPVSAGVTVRYLRSLDPAKPVVLLTSTNRNKFRLMSESPREVETAIWEAAAAGGGIWNALVAGANPDTFPDRRNARLAAPVFEFLARHGPALGGQRPVAEAAILFAAATRDHASAGFRFAMEGAERVLAARHIPYAFVPAERLGPEELRGVKALLLPNVAALSDDTVGRIRDYVAGGGTIIADFQTSLLDATGRRRDDFALADVLGVTFAGKIFEVARDSPLKIRRRHPLLNGWEATDFLLNGGRMAACRARGAEVLATRVPAPPAVVPEQTWLRTPETDDVAVAIHRFGRGQAIFFAHEIMRQSREDGHADFADLLGRAIELALGPGRMVQTDAPPSVRLSLLADGRGHYTLSLINHTSTPWRPMRVRIPVRDFEVTLQLPGSHIVSSSVVHGGDAIAITAREDGGVRLRVGRLDAFAAVALVTRPAEAPVPPPRD